MTDSDANRYYLDNVLGPSVFCVDLAKADLSEGLKTMRRAVMGSVDLAGGVSKKLTPAEPYGFLTPYSWKPLAESELSGCAAGGNI